MQKENLEGYEVLYKFVIDVLLIYIDEILSEEKRKKDVKKKRKQDFSDKKVINEKYFYQVLIQQSEFVVVNLVDEVFLLGRYGGEYYKYTVFLNFFY